MAALANRSDPTPGVIQATLHAFATVDTWTADPAVEAVEYLVEAVSDDYLGMVPAAVGEVVPLLRSDPERMRVALDAIIRLDLHEALDGLYPLLLRQDRSAVLTAAAVSTGSGESSPIYDLLVTTASLLSEADRDLFETRVRPTYEPATEPARWERQVRWNLGNPADQATAAAVIRPIGPHFPPSAHLRVVLDLAKAGVTVVRRSLDRASVHRAVPVIGPDSTDGSFQVSRMPTPLARNRLLGAVQARYPRASLRVARQDSASKEPSVPSLDDFQVFQDGALGAREVVYLTGTSYGQLLRTKDQPALMPRSLLSQYYWSFNQVVGLRTAKYLFAQRGRTRGLPEVAAKIVETVNEREAVPIGITSDRRVVFDDNGRLTDIESGEVSLDGIIEFADKIFRPFTVSKGIVPNLLQPSGHTAVHPAIAQGTPCVASTRIPVEVLDRAVRAARASRSGDASAYQVVGDLFDLEAAQVEDASHLAVAIGQGR